MNITIVKEESARKMALLPEAATNTRISMTYPLSASYANSELDLSVKNGTKGSNSLIFTPSSLEYRAIHDSPICYYNRVDHSVIADTVQWSQAGATVVEGSLGMTRLRPSCRLQLPAEIQLYFWPSLLP